VLEGGDTSGFSVSVYFPSHRYSTLSGSRDPATKSPITENTAFRIASITKTYVASTVLRLWEEGLIDLQSPISDLIDPTYDQWLREDGYNTDQMLLIHLLTHTAGVFDHAQDPRYISAVFSEPAKEWTRAAQIKASVEWGDPVGKPGEIYSDSDTGYVLIGNIIERVTGDSLPTAVRRWLGFEQLGINQTYWELFEESPPNLYRAHQFYETNDTYNWSPTIDLYGGGGLVATPSDVALFFNKLLTGKVFKHANTLARMLSKDQLPESSPYRIGIFEFNIDGKTIYEHSGFWGTLVWHDPTTGKTIAGAAISGADASALKRIIADAIKE